MLRHELNRMIHVACLKHKNAAQFLEPRDYEEYLAPSERQPVHLLRILPAEKMRARLVETTPISNKQVSLFDSQ
jgi:putative SOS response-associated peptidase YedK